MRKLLKWVWPLALGTILLQISVTKCANRPHLESIILSRSRNLKSPRIFEHERSKPQSTGDGGGVEWGERVKSEAPSPKVKVTVKDTFKDTVKDTSAKDAVKDVNLVNGMIDVVLSTLESKLRKVENLDRAVQVMMRKMDTMGNKLGERTAKLLDRLDEMEVKEEERHEYVSKKLDYLAKKFDSVCEEDVSDLQEDFVALPSIRSSRLLPVDGSNGLFDALPSPKSPVVNKEIFDAMDKVKETVSGMDRRLAFHINIVAENLGKMSSKVEEVHEALVEEDVEVKPTFNGRRKVVRARNGTLISTQRPKRSKLEQLLVSVKPLNRVMYNVREKVEEMRGLIQGNKNVMENEVLPKSEKILERTLLHDRSITSLESDLHGKTDKILEELEKFSENKQRLADDLMISERSSQLLFLPHTSPGGATPTNGDLQSSGSATAFISTPFDAQYNNLDSNDSTLFNGPSGQGSTDGITRGPSVIFPSVENKPIVINSSFTYDTGINLNGAHGYSCADLYDKGLHDDDVYYLQIDGTRFWYLKVFCEMEKASGGWTVIQRRSDYGEPRTSFNRNWEEYKYGFGDPRTEFWLGNENIHMLTRSGEHELRIELEDFEGNVRYAEYKSFRLGSEKESYRLEIGGYQGNAGDSLNDPWYGSNLRPFSTYDNDNDRSSLNCASMLKGGWWWKSCGRGLNGLYLQDPQDLTARQGIVWFRWRGWDYSLKRSKMMIRPKKPAKKGEEDEGDAN